jgi:murein DD-endopeptidase MepM/ murein hydrolase activator NlpD
MTSLVPRPGALRVVLTVLSALALLVVLAGPASSAGAEDPDPVGVWPLDPRPDVVATFDPPDDRWGAGHRGVDLAGRIGQPVRSALAGEVAFAGSIAGKPVVTVSHGDTRTTYEPVVASVAVGTRVAAGEVIGVLDLAASHCFPRACLHWGWRRGETYLDPLDLVGGGPVRLLPLWRDEPAAGGAWRPPVHPYAAWSPLVGDTSGPDASDPAVPVSVPVALGLADRGRDGPPPGGRPLEPLP